jgi:hypothetical protein
VVEIRKTIRKRGSEKMKHSEFLTKKRLQLIREYGNKCFVCGNVNNLQFAHIKPTKIKGVGRGKQNRTYDVQKNPKSYILLCPTCHYYLDNKILKY